VVIEIYLIVFGAGSTAVICVISMIDTFSLLSILTVPFKNALLYKDVLNGYVIMGVQRYY
jgi:hypothetical protein